MFKKLFFTFLAITIIASPAMYAMEPAAGPIRYSERVRSNSEIQLQEELYSRIMKALDEKNLKTLEQCFEDGFDLDATHNHSITVFEDISKSSISTTQVVVNHVLLNEICSLFAKDTWYLNALELFLNKRADPDFKCLQVDPILRIAHYPVSLLIQDLLTGSWLRDKKIDEPATIKALKLLQTKGAKFDQHLLYKAFDDIAYYKKMGFLSEEVFESFVPCYAAVTNLILDAMSPKSYGPTFFRDINIDDQPSKILEVILQHYPQAHAEFKTIRQNPFLKNPDAARAHRLVTEYNAANAILNACAASRDCFLAKLPRDLHAQLINMRVNANLNNSASPNNPEKPESNSSIVHSIPENSKPLSPYRYCLIQ